MTKRLPFNFANEDMNFRDTLSFRKLKGEILTVEEEAYLAAFTTLLELSMERPKEVRDLVDSILLEKSKNHGYNPAPEDKPFTEGYQPSECSLKLSPPTKPPKGYK